MSFSPSPSPSPVILIHGGAGLITQSYDPHRILERRALRHILRTAQSFLSSSPPLSSIDIVERVVMMLEDCPLFNAGKGAVYTNNGDHEMDVTIMNGINKKCGAATGLKTTKNPIQLARLLLSHSPHIMLYGQHADDYAKQMGLAQVENEYFDTKKRFDQYVEGKNGDGKPMVDANAEEKTGKGMGKGKGNPTEMTDGNVSQKDPNPSLGTVGCVCCDSFGNISVATSTGGMSNKWSGRVGDSAIIGGGSYADNTTAAVSCTGHGESFYRGVIAYDVSARMKYLGSDLHTACTESIMKSLGPLGEESKGGLIAVDNMGNLSMPYNSEGMYRGWVRKEGKCHVFVWEKEEKEEEEGEGEEENVMDGTEGNGGEKKNGK